MRKRLGLLLPLLPLLPLLACGGGVPRDIGDPPDLPGPAEIADARGRLEAAAGDADQLRAALERLGLLPSYTCGEPQGGYVGRLVADLDARHGCAELTVDSSDPARDVVTVAFPAAGCEVDGHLLAGAFALAVAAGDESFLLELDVARLVVDGRSAPVVARYATCGDETRYGASVSGATSRLDVTVAARAGVPVIGGTTLIVDGTGTRDGDRLTLTGLEYELGDPLPEAGTILLETADGRRIQATFTRESPLVLEVEVVIDGHDPVTIPLPA